MKRIVFTLALSASILASSHASTVVIDYKATGLFTPLNPATSQTGFRFAFSAPEAALYGVASYSTSSTLAFSNGLTFPSTLTFTPTVVKQVGEQDFTAGNEFDFSVGAEIPSYRFFLAGDNITDGRRGSQPGDLTDTNFVTGTHTGDANSMITYPSSTFAPPHYPTSFVTTPVDNLAITGTVTPVPEASSMATIALLTCLLGWSWRDGVARTPERVFAEFRKGAWLTGDIQVFVDDINGVTLFNDGFPERGETSMSHSKAATGTLCRLSKVCSEMSQGGLVGSRVPARLPAGSAGPCRPWGEASPRQCHAPSRFPRGA